VSDYDDPVSAEETVRSIASGTRDGMARVMRLGAVALQAAEDAASVAEEIDWLAERLSECAVMCIAMAAVLREGADA